jgi:hypothetical protein
MYPVVWLSNAINGNLRSRIPWRRCFSKNDPSESPATILVSEAMESSEILHHPDVGGAPLRSIKGYMTAVG